MPLWESIESLRGQTYRNLRIVIVDNSGCEKVAASWPASIPRDGVTILHPGSNIGFGAAVNRAYKEAPCDFLAVLNDDAAAGPDWIAALVDALTRTENAGSAASQVKLHGAAGKLDSAGMLIAADGTSKQRGHGEPSISFSIEEEVLLASGSASMYRAKMLDETGGFDDDYFLYCEDTDLGLRARWAGWTCLYVPGAVVAHRYSHSAGRASKLKAYYVERNRLFTVIKNFPAGRLLTAPFATLVRYWHHLRAMRAGHGAAAHARTDGTSPLTLVALVVKAHLAALANLPALISKRRAIRKRIDNTTFNAALDRHSISVEKVAWL